MSAFHDPQHMQLLPRSLQLDRRLVKKRDGQLSPAIRFSTRARWKTAPTGNRHLRYANEIRLKSYVESGILPLFKGLPEVSERSLSVQKGAAFAEAELSTRPKPVANMLKRDGKQGVLGFDTRHSFTGCRYVPTLLALTSRSEISTKAA